MSELSPEARALIDASLSSDEPNTADRARVAHRISAQLGVTALAVTGVGSAAKQLGAASESAFAPAPTGVFASVKATVSASVVKVMATAVVVGAISTAIWTFAPSHSTQQEPANRVQLPAPTTGVVEAEPTRAEPLPSSPSSSSAALRNEQAPTSATPLSPVSSQPSSRKAFARAKVERVPSPVDESSLDRELALVGSAQRALREGKASVALAQAQEHLHAFANGVLREEALAVQALAKCALGDKAEEVVREFVGKAPASVLLPRVRAACTEGVK